MKLLNLAEPLAHKTMYCLEESQLLEDTIVDKDLCKLYNLLRLNEASNDPELYINQILLSNKGLELTKILLELHAIQLASQSSDKFKYPPEQVDALLVKLGLKTKDDLAALALVLSATFVQLFVVYNFVNTASEPSHSSLPQHLIQFSQNIDHKSLAVDGFEVHHMISECWLLKLAQLSWNFLESTGNRRKMLDLEFLVWKHRYLTVHLMLFLEPAESIQNEIKKLQEFIFDHHIINDARENTTQLSRFNIVELCCELIQSCLHRGGLTFCHKFYDYASETSGISIEHTGALGKRTRFQQKDLSQLVIKVSTTNAKEHESQQLTPEEMADLPLDVKLDDDTLLPDISFAPGGDVDETSEPNIGAQLLMLADLEILLKTEAMEESLRDEYALAFLRTLSRSASVWSLKHKVLVLRSQVERKHMRKMDRALRQMEELIKIEKSVGSRSRLRCFYSTLPLSQWQVHRSLGDMSCDLGLFKNALSIYQKIEYWDGIIKCHCALHQSSKAESIIRQELTKNETSYLYCLLGDVTDNIEYYEKSWALSKSRFARAKKSIGTYYYVRKQYPEAIEHYEQALKASPSNIGILSLLAYCCLALERYERAAECYRNITYEDDGNFLAWNNLSKAYLKMDQKERAWRTLREAIKCNYEEWKIWENFMVVSADLNAFDDVIIAWHRLIDIKSSHKDDQILNRLTYWLTSVPSSQVNSEYNRLLKDALKLIGRLQSTSDCSPRFWICYYKLLIKEFDLTQHEFKQEDRVMSKLELDSRVSKIINALQRATPTTLLNDNDWVQAEKANHVVDLFNELVECYQFAFEVLGPQEKIWRQWKYLKLTMTNCLKLLEIKGYRKVE